MNALLAAILLACLVACAPAEPPATEGGDDEPAVASGSRYAQAALSAAEWIRSTAIETEHGVVWPADPRDTGAVSTNLYTGTPGVVLFFLELAAHTGNDAFLDDARRGADHLLALTHGPVDAASNQTVQVAGLYTGVAGIGFVLHETWKATGDDRYRAGARRAVDRIHEQAQEAGEGVYWVDSTDIVSGSAGTGLFLLYAAREMNDPASLELAARAGKRLLEVAEPHPTGLGWRINAEYPRLMPNFSHGTAGVAYFLAALHEATGETAFLDAATAGAERLLSLAETEGDVCLVFHHTEGGEELQYLSWCHGPAGTARTFYELFRITGEERWMEWTEKSANGVYQSGIPETLTDGFWNNVGQCCGSAGVVEFSLAMHGVSGEPRHLEFAQRVTDNLLSRAADGRPGLMWVQAEHRVQPDFLVAQTGFMQGAAGIGIALLHLDAALEGRPSRSIVFPDSPF